MQGTRNGESYNRTVLVTTSKIKQFPRFSIQVRKRLSVLFDLLVIATQMTATQTQHKYSFNSVVLVVINIPVLYYVSPMHLLVDMTQLLLPPRRHPQGKQQPQAWLHSSPSNPIVAIETSQTPSQRLLHSLLRIKRNKKRVGVFFVQFTSRTTYFTYSMSQYNLQYLLTYTIPLILHPRCSLVQIKKKNALQIFPR